MKEGLYIKYEWVFDIFILSLGRINLNNIWYKFVVRGSKIRFDKKRGFCFIFFEILFVYFSIF